MFGFQDAGRQGLRGYLLLVHTLILAPPSRRAIPLGGIVILTDGATEAMR